MMNASVYKNLFTELKEGRKAVVFTAMEKQNCKNTLFNRKLLIKEEDLIAPDNNYNLEECLIAPDSNYNLEECLIAPDSNYNLEEGLIAKDSNYNLEEGLIAKDSNYNLEEVIDRNIREAISTGNIRFYESSDQKAYLMEPYFPEPRLIIFGGGHIAKPLSEFGAKVGFSVTVIDDRPFFASKARFPEAENVICESFERSFNLLNLNMSAFVVIITRGHRHDLECLRQVLEYDTAYVGMIGSKRRVKSVKEQLLSESYSEEILQKVNAPIGLDIGAITPEEIAIAIIAQVISYRRCANLKESSETVRINWIEFDPSVLMEMSKESDEPNAIVTVVSTKGSVPRKAGAKMLVWADGRTLGSIGGGCSEGAIIRKALTIIKNGGYQIEKIDMTGYLAEEEGMVCGGIMEVLIEACNR